MKLTEYGVSTACLKWLRSYLSQRLQQTSVGDALSSKRNVTIGVPQGSVLGPLLFLVFINDLPLSVKYSKTILFADDTAIYFSGKNCNEIQNKMNEDFVLVKKWLNDHRMTLNITKSKFVVVGGKQQLKLFQDLTLKIEEDELSRESSYKYIGIIINENMTWGGDHIASLQQKVAKRIGLIKRISHLILRAQHLTLVNNMIIPSFDYGDTVWEDRNNQCLMKTLQILHNKCAKIVLNMKPFESSTNALDSLHWKSLDFRRKFHRCAIIYKSKKNDISYTFNNKTGKDLHNIQTRNNEQYHLPK